MNKFSHRRVWGPTPNYPRVECYARPSDEFIIQSGSCSIENNGLTLLMAKFLSQYGVTHMRGHCFKAGTYPGEQFGFIDLNLIQTFQSHANLFGMKTVMEVLDYSDEAMEIYLEYGDSYQVGARAAQNYTLLKKLSVTGKDIFLKRSSGATIDEWLGACEYLLQGNCNPILVERGSSTFHNDVRWTPTLHVIPSIKQITSVPIIVDASHGTGRRDLVEPMTLAGVAAGADGILVEVHPSPDQSVSDPDQAIDFNHFDKLINKVNRIREIL